MKAMKKFFTVMTALFLTIMLCSMSVYAVPSSEGGISTVPENNLSSTEETQETAEGESSLMATVTSSERLPDGIYRISSADVADKYLTVYNHGYTTGTDVIAKSLNPNLNRIGSGTMPDPSQLWRVECEDAQELIYAIRPAHIPSLALTNSGTNIDITYDDIYSFSTKGAAQWTIELDGEGRYIVYNNENISKMLTLAEEEIPKNLLVSSEDEILNQHWVFTEMNLGGFITMNGPAVVKVGETIQMQAGVCSITNTDQYCDYATGFGNVSITPVSFGSKCNITGERDGIAVIQVTSSSDSTVSDYFTVIVITGYHDISLFGIPAENHDHLASLQQVKTDASSYVSNIYLKNAEVKSPYAETLNRHFAASTLTIIRSHGRPGEIIVNEVSEELLDKLNDPESEGYSDLDFLAFMSADMYAYSGYLFTTSECVLLVACNTGSSDVNGNNLVDALYAKGVKYVLGFTTEILCHEANAWTVAFSAAVKQQLSAGVSLEDIDFAACWDVANLSISSNSTVKNQYYRYADEP